MNLSNIHQQIPKRYILSLLAFFGFFNSYILRSNLSIAIIAMVKPTTNLSTNHASIISTADYNWSTITQGYILSSFFYSYTIIQIPAGFLATTYGGKFLFGSSVGISAVLTLFTPLCAKQGVASLIILRVLEGFSSGFIYPSLHSVWSKWAPKNDISKLATFAFSGSYVGTLVTMLFGGLIATHWSWEWIFYLSGTVGLVWTLVWFYSTAESPSTHPTISTEEVTYIETNLSHAVSQKYAIPWKDILTSFPVWAIIAAHFTTNWSIYLAFIELPLFLNRALDYRVDTAGILAGIPWLLLAILIYGTGCASDRLTEKYSTAYVRKLIMSISFMTISIAFSIVTLLTERHQTLIIIVITIAIASCGPAWASFGVNHLDIGGHYAGILMGLSNSIGSTPGFLVPMVTGYVVRNTHLKREWNGIFMISILICVLVLMFYTFFASGELQSWASKNNMEYQHVLTNRITPQNVSQETSNNIDDLTDRLKAEMRPENNIK